MVNYELGKIYKIVCNTTNQCYVGSTCNPLLSTRLAGHRSDYKFFKETGKGGEFTSFKVLENNSYEIILIEKCPCKDKMELHARERYWIENTECVNKVIPTRTDSEYYEDNKTQIDSRNSKNYYKNREQYLQRDKQYREANKEKISERCQKFRAENKEKMNERAREYYENNKEKKKQYALENKEKIHAYLKQYREMKKLKSTNIVNE